jgi:SAM-dependent methyltransferase
MKVIELATRENFNVDGYIRLNRDIAEHVCRGGNAWQHFVEYGEKEGRLQISTAYWKNRGSYGRAKFERFKIALIIEHLRSSQTVGTKPSKKGVARICEKIGQTAQRKWRWKETMEASRGKITGVHFLEQEGAFPVVFSDQHFSRGDYASESANETYGPFAETVMANPDKLFLDLGCGLRREVFENCLYLEVYPSITADIIVRPDCAYPIASNTFDGIGCFAVLEHVTKPWKVAEEIHRMLKPGGKCYIDWPFLQPIHGYPSHYYNATRQGLELMFSDGFDLEFCRTEPFQSPALTIAWVLGKFVNDLPTDKKNQMLEMTVADLITQTQMGEFWTNLLRDLPEHLISEFACGNTLVATKR